MTSSVARPANTPRGRCIVTSGGPRGRDPLRGVMRLLRGGSGLEVVERADVPAHAARLARPGPSGNALFVHAPNPPPAPACAVASGHGEVPEEGTAQRGENRKRTRQKSRHMANSNA